MTRRHLRELRTEFDIPPKAQQYVITLDIPMNNAMTMEMLQSLACLPAHSRNLALCHQVRSNDICQTSPLHILHYDPKIILVQKRVDVVYNVRVSRSAHDEDLVNDEVFLGLFIQVHLLDRD
jgi:hypothetical protein